MRIPQIGSKGAQSVIHTVQRWSMRATVPRSRVAKWPDIGATNSTRGSPGRWYGISGTWPTFITKYGVIGGTMSSPLQTPCSVSATSEVEWVWMTQRASGSAS